VCLVQHVALRYSGESPKLIIPKDPHLTIVEIYSTAVQISDPDHGWQFENASFVQPPQRLVNLQIYDTGGDEKYDRRRQAIYLSTRTNVILLCFNIGVPDNLVNIRDKVSLR
jgi:GTPase SAR1 family protein